MKIHPKRITILSDKSQLATKNQSVKEHASSQTVKKQSGKEHAPSFVIYWMQASVRTRYNLALAYAIDQAITQNCPLLVYFGLTPSYPNANYRHYQFLLEGLWDVQTELIKLNIPFIIERCSPEIGISKLSSKANLIVTDVGYTLIQRQWRELLTEQANCPVIQIEDNVTIPVKELYPKEAYSAAVLRRHVHEKMNEFKFSNPSLSYNVKTNFLFNDLMKILNIETKNAVNIGSDKDISTLLSEFPIDASVLPSKRYKGGEKQAQKELHHFFDNELKHYTAKRSDPSSTSLSNLSPYLHFGNISVMDVIQQVQSYPPEWSESFLEELIVRRELAVNLCFYNKDYNNIKCLPSWALQSLQNHQEDKRVYIYTLSDLEEAKTHDLYWNACQNEMKLTGKMHGYMRMYWGKKVLEWTPSADIAFNWLIYLNDKYELDGRDPNGYAGVAWCFGKHDRPWPERAIFGTVRTMMASGLEKKFNMKAYLNKMDKLKNDN